MSRVLWEERDTLKKPAPSLEACAVANSAAHHPLVCFRVRSGLGPAHNQSTNRAPTGHQPATNRPPTGHQPASLHYRYTDSEGRSAHFTLEHDRSTAPRGTKTPSCTTINALFRRRKSRPRNASSLIPTEVVDLEHPH